MTTQNKTAMTEEQGQTKGSLHISNGRNTRGRYSVVVDGEVRFRSNRKASCDEIAAWLRRFYPHPFNRNCVRVVLSSLLHGE